MRNLSRRHVLRSAGIGAAGVASIAAFAACGETKTVEVEKIVTQIVEVEKVVEKQVAVEKQVVKTVEVAAKKTNFEIRFVTDHTAGPRGAAMQWGLQKFAELRPDIFVKLEPTGNLI
ncbi:MAG: hypothetical protein CL790_07600, partial [Chloroflexi bacterium]|nr:hypothetical protein [Chloroflexota bacterium]